ncbi:acyl-CoA dehydrogenase family protein [Tistrella bauzanensis]|uniref:acyl-CoA dehydrogenase family protein n=1 Tax=Tistrella TaxID=171436 RepID=UPI0031F6906D
MDFSLSDEQQLLIESVERFVRNEYAFDARRKLSETEDGISARNWGTLADMGLLAVMVPEDQGGIGGSMVDAALILERLGGGLVLEPFMPTAVLGARALTVGAAADVRDDLLGRVAEGALKIAFAHYEPRGRYNRTRVTTKAERSGEGFTLSGVKAVVRNAQHADKIIVSARTAGAERDADGITLFLIDRDADGVSLRGYRTVDGGRAADVTLTNVAVGADAVLGEVDGGAGLLSDLLDHGAVAVSAEAIGAMKALHTLTVDYLKTREQFGVAIANFQVLQHAAVDMMNHFEQSRSLAYAAAMALAESDDDAQRARAAAACKAHASRSARLVGQAGIQLHGGIGMTEEYAGGHYFKRLTMIEGEFGDRDHHLDRMVGFIRSAA